MADQTPPAGFTPVTASPFAQRLGPLYRNTDPDHPLFGMTVGPELSNTNGTGHGGFLAAFVDIAVTRGARILLGDGRSIWTVSSTVDFIAPVAVGDWVEAAVSVDRAGSRTVFATARLTSAGLLVTRASAILSTTPTPT